MILPKQNSLNALKEAGTAIASDTGEYNEIATFEPVDATTNPSLVLAAVLKSDYSPLVDLAVKYAIERRKNTEEQTDLAMDRLLVEVGCQILKIIPGKVSVSVDPRLGYNQEAMVQKGLSLSRIFTEVGIGSERFLIKIPATWEGIQAARTLEQVYNLRVNMTLVFGLVQAKACAEIGATVISPFVGRVMDWHKKETGRTVFPISEHPGVLMVQNIKKLYIERGYRTKIMAAGFRNVEEIAALAGLDLMTLGPSLLSTLQTSTKSMKCTIPTYRATSIGHSTEYIEDGAHFRAALLLERIAVEKVAEGLEKFSTDAQVLEDKIRDRVQGSAFEGH